MAEVRPLILEGGELRQVRDGDMLVGFTQTTSADLWINLDGGAPDSIYEGLPVLDGGGV